MTLRSMEVAPEHECNGDKTGLESDICHSCGDHSGFCSICGLSECCSFSPIRTDIDKDY